LADESDCSTPPPLEIALRRAKFTVPNVPSRALPRDRLITRLETMTQRCGANGCVTVLCAPVASGKTTLAAMLARTRPPGTVAWCTIDANDNNRLAFGTSVLEAVLASQSDRQTLVSSSARAATDALDEAVLIAAYSERLLLVLDGCEHIELQNAHATIVRLMRQAPPSLSILLITDRDFPPTVANTSDAMFLRAPDLAFTMSEMRALFDAERVPIDDVALETLTEWTEGVASTSTLAATVLHDARERERVNAAALKSQTCAHAFLFDRLLRRLPDDQRAVLLSSAIVDPVCADLVGTISGRADVAPLLHELVRTGVFFDPVPGTASWFRHHHPSRGMLAGLMQRVPAAERKVLHQRAARWFHAHGHSDRALEAAVTGEDWPLVVELVRALWTRAALDETDAPVRDVQEPPQEVQASSRDARLAAIALHLEHGRVSLAHAALDELVAEAPVKHSDPPSSALFAALVALRVARDAGDAAAITAACKDLVRVCAAPSVAEGRRVDASLLATRSQAEALLLVGDLDGAARLLEQASATAATHGRERQTADATAALAVVTALSGRIRRAAALVEELGDGWLEGGNFSRGVRETARALCAYHEDRLPAALAAASEARVALRSGVFRDVIVTMVRARIAASVGDEAAAARLTSRAAGNENQLLVEVVSEALGLSCRVRGARMTARVEDHASPDAIHPYAFARRNAREAIALHADERDEEAWEHLERTLALVRRNAYWRLFADLGIETRPLLCDYLSVGRPSSPVAWQLIQRLPASRPASDVPIVETLTPRELAVLRHLPSMKSNREIAAEMFFSVNTVKTHLKSIYRKLGVNRRRAAVEEARARSLL
jgi:LuxR family maltose regulon positive regulatory protein